MEYAYAGGVVACGPSRASTQSCAPAEFVLALVYVEEMPAFVFAPVIGSIQVAEYPGTISAPLTVIVCVFAAGL